MLNIMKNNILDCHSFQENIVCNITLSYEFVPSRFQGETVYGKIKDVVQSDYNTCMVDTFNNLICSGLVYYSGWLLPKPFIPFDVTNYEIDVITSNNGFTYDPLGPVVIDGYRIDSPRTYVKDLAFAAPKLIKNISFDKVGILNVLYEHGEERAKNIVLLNHFETFFIYFGLVILLTSLVFVTLLTNNILNPVSMGMGAALVYATVHIIVWDTICAFAKTTTMYGGIATGYFVIALGCWYLKKRWDAKRENLETVGTSEDEDQNLVVANELEHVDEVYKT